MVAAASVACLGPEVEAPPTFLREAVLLSSGTEGREVGGGRRLVPRSEGGGGSFAWGGRSFEVPEQPACAALFSRELGDVDAWIAMGGEPPDTAMAFDPTGDRLAVGTWTGDVWVLDAWTGRVIARDHLDEAVVKQVAWSPDGATLYAAEQSPDAWVLALDPHTLEVRGRLRLADHVGSSAPPAGNDLYGVYALPAAYALAVLPDGELVAAATHGWNDAYGVRRNRARVLRLGPTLDVRAAWPPTEAADAVVLSTTVGGGRVAVSLGRSADGPAPVDLPVDAVWVLALPELTPERVVAIPPLRPWYDRTFVWEAVGLTPGGDVAVGLGDGRVVWSGGDGVTHTRDLGTPLQLGDVAIAAAIAELVVVGDRVLALTGGTNIPFGTANPELRPPAAHPDENALFALRHDPGGWALDAAWRLPHRLSGVTVSPDGGWAVVGAGPRERDEREDLFGAVIVPWASGGAPIPCPTGAPVFFRHAVTADGRIAVSEHPWRSGAAVRGSYRVTVLR